MKLNIPKTGYISTYTVGKIIVDNAVEVFQPYWELIHQSQDHIRGAPPVPYEELEKRGLGWADNDNLGKAKAKIEKGVGANVSKMSVALALSYVTFRSYNASKDKGKFTEFLSDQNLRGVVAGAIGSAFTTMLSKEHRLGSFFNDIEYPSYAFGFAALCFNDTDWAPDVVHPSDIAFRPKSKPSDLKTWVVFRTVHASFLYERYVEAYNEQLIDVGDSKVKLDPLKDESFASNGWSRKALEEVLLRAFRGKLNKGTSGNPQMESPETWSDVFDHYIASESNQSWVMENTEDVTIAKIFHIELDGTLSVVYIPYSGIRNYKLDAWAPPIKKKNQLTSTNESNTIDYRLYYKNYNNSSGKEKLILIRDSGFTETTYIEDLRGICRYAVKDSIRHNRVMNNMGNKLKFSGSPFFEKTTGVAGDSFKLGIGPGYVITQQEYPLAQRQPTFDIGADMAYLNFSENNYLRETESYDPSLRGRLSSRPNKDEVRGQQAEVEQLEASKNYVKYLDYSLAFGIMLRRLGDSYEANSDAHEGQRRFCEKLIELLGKEPFNIKTKTDVKNLLKCIDAFRLEEFAGNEGDIMMAIQMAETPFARNRYRRMLMALKGFPIEEINIAIPLITDKFTNFDDQMMATFENDMFWNGNDAMVSGKNDHPVHLDVHYGKASKIREGVLQGKLSPIDATKYLMNLLSHTMTHLQFLGEDPTLRAHFERYDPIQREFIKFHKEVEAQAAQLLQQQQQAAAQPQVDQETLNEMARKNVESQEKIRRQRELQENRTVQTNQRIENEHVEEMTRIELDNQRKQAEQLAP